MIAARLEASRRGLRTSMSLRAPVIAALRRLLPILFMLGACQPLPHPFADDTPPPGSPILSPRDSVGIVVAPVAGLPAAAGTQLTEAMAAALRAHDIPASTQGQNKGSYRLVAVAREQSRADGHSALSIDWQLLGANGRPVGHAMARADGSSLDAAAGDTDTAKALAAQAAPALAHLVQDDAPAAAADADPVVRIDSVSGAAGDGDPALARAMDEVLRRAHIKLAELGTTPSFVLAAKVVMGKPAAGQQRVKIAWTLARPDGGEIGRISQENAVPSGSLDGVWGDVAYAIAQAAGPGVTALIERAQTAELGH
jgi:hypothetical protein